MPYYFLEKPEVIKKFSGKNHTDIHIHNVGYNNFDYIKPIMLEHSQHSFTIHYVISGSGTLILNGKTHKIKEKQLFFIPPHQNQMYFPDPDNNWKYIWLFFGGSHAKQMGEDMGFSVDSPVKAPKDYENIERSLVRLIENAEKNKINEYMAISALYEIAGCLSPESSTDSISVKCAFEAAQLLNLNFANSNLQVGDLCELLHVSHSSLCKEFRREYNTTPLKYLIQLRMTHAAALLTESNLSVKDISALSGYGDEIHFIKAFKSYYGMTASKYRQNTKKTKQEDTK